MSSIPARCRDGCCGGGDRRGAIRVGGLGPAIIAKMRRLGLHLPMLSHNIWLPDKSVELSPFAFMAPPGGSHNLAKSAIRALDVLELFARLDRPLRSIEIAKQLGISPSSAAQLLK